MELERTRDRRGVETKSGYVIEEEMTMRVPLPELDFRPEMVRENKARIKEARAALQGALKALDGLQKANEGMCQHPNPRRCYDPGYAGGGYSHSECDYCGGTLV